MRKLILAAGLAIAAVPTVANAADLTVYSPEVIASSATDWSGFYAGVNVGYGPGTADLGGEGYGISFSGLFGGGQIGYNVQLDNGLVWGLEGDLNLTNESGTTSYNYSDYYSYVYTDTLNWSGAITGHLGYAFDNFMPYVLGGVAFANNTVGYDYNYYDDSEQASGSATHLGYTVGLGAAAMLTDNISIFTEVRYADYGSASYTWDFDDDDSYTFPVSLVDTTVRGGLNVRF